MRHRYRLLSVALVGVTSLFVAPLLVGLANAQSSSLAQGFQIDESQGTVVAGALVSLEKDTPGVVQLANTTNSDYLLGVADPKALVTFTQQGQQAQIVLNGTTTALVSDINGPIENGDNIAASPIAGVGMKATRSGQIVGRATSSASGGKQTSIKDKSGKVHNVRLTRVNLEVNVGHFEVPNSSALPTSIQNIANDIAGRDVTTVRVLLATVLLVVGFASVLIIVFISIRSTVAAIGRNPMAAPAIRRGLHEVLLISLVVAVGCLVLSYLSIRI